MKYLLVIGSGISIIIMELEKLEEAIELSEKIETEQEINTEIIITK